MALSGFDNKVPSDEILLARMARGDEEAFTQIYHRYHNKLYSFAFDLTRSGEKARDIVHDVFAWLWEQRATLEGREVASSYLFRMTHNRQVDQLRRFARETLILAELAKTTPSQPEGPDALLDYREMQETLHHVIRQLPARQQEVYQLHREQGLTYAEIAIRLNLSPSTIENHFTRAMAGIRDHLHRHFTLTLFYSLLLTATVAG